MTAKSRLSVTIDADLIAAGQAAVAAGEAESISAWVNDAGDREVLARVKQERRLGRAPLTNGGVVAQVWRGGHGKQALIAKLLASVDVASLDDRLGRHAGMLLARAGTTDAIDASVICLAQDGDDILTSDPADLLDRARAAGAHVELIPV